MNDLHDHDGFDDIDEPYIVTGCDPAEYDFEPTITQFRRPTSLQRVLDMLEAEAQL